MPAIVIRRAKDRPQHNFSSTLSPLAGEGRVRGSENRKLFCVRSQPTKHVDWATIRAYLPPGAASP